MLLTYYKNDEGISVRKRYQEKNAIKRQLIEEITKITVNKKAKLCQESILKLMNML